jgi:hypothetical protein
MTENRGRKRLVRDRMAHTGESYTTANRHVQARVTPVPDGIVPGYAEFGGGQHRLSTLVTHLLTQRGITAPHTGEPYSEAMICGLAGGIGFMYAIFEYKGLPPMLTIVAQHHPDPWAESVLGRLEVGFIEKHSTSTGAAVAALRGAIGEGTAVWCLVVRNHLPWHDVRPEMEHDPYPVIVAGADGDTLYVDDRASTPRSIAADDFGTAWAAHRKSRHHRLVLTGPQRADLGDAIRAAIATTVAHLTGPVLGHSFDANFGFSGMGRLAAQMRDTKARTAWVRRFDGAHDIAARRLFECLEKEYTAPGATRPLYADFLDEAAGVLGEDRLSATAALFRESGAVWSAIAERAADDPGAHYAELADLVDSAKSIEDQAVELLALARRTLD